VAKLDVRRKRNGPGELLGELSRVARELGLDEKHRDQPFEELSGGERARLYLSLVLATQPDVLLLDEPTSALDQSSKELVERQLQGRTALIVTHEAAQVDRLSAETLVMGS
jgi:phosphate transport system ATP-binding protein